LKIVHLFTDSVLKTEKTYLTRGVRTDWGKWD